MVAELLREGFELRGSFSMGNNRIPRLEGDIPIHPGLYAFATNQRVRYIGQSSSSIRERISNYLARQRRIALTRVVHEGIASTDG